MSRQLAIWMICLLTVFPCPAAATPYERPKVKLPDPMGYVSDHAKVLEEEWLGRGNVSSVARRNVY